MLNEKILEKEKKIKIQLECLRSRLNSNRIVYNKNPKDWKYITSLSFTENKLKEILEFLEEGDIIGQ